MQNRQLWAEMKFYLVWILAGDAGCNNVPSWNRNAVWSFKVDDGVTPRTFPIKHSDILNSVQRDAHRNLPDKTLTVKDLTVLMQGGPTVYICNLFLLTSFKSQLEPT